MDSSTKIRENRLRRAAARQGLELSRTRRRDPRALDFGSYSLVRAGMQHHYALTLDEVEARLTGARER
jgi:hypothetical protein